MADEDKAPPPPPPVSQYELIHAFASAVSVSGENENSRQVVARWLEENAPPEEKAAPEEKASTESRAKDTESRSKTSGGR